MTASTGNDHAASRLAKNFTLLLGSQATTFLLAVAATVVIPRYLGDEVVGRLHLATAIWLLGGAVIGFGMDLAIQKAVALDPSMIGELAVSAITTRLLIAFPVAFVVFIYGFGVGYSNQVMVLLVILGVTALAVAMATVAEAILVGLERVGAVSAGAVAGRFVTVGGAVILLLAGFDVFAVAVVGVVGAVITTLIQFRALRGAWAELDGTPPGRATRETVVALLNDCRPYFWVAFFMVAYQQIDMIVISLVVSNDSVLGWYSVYDRLAGTLMFVPMVFMTVMYPTLSRMYAGSEELGSATLEEHQAVIGRSFRLMMMISVPAGFGLAALARPFIELLYGEDFSEAGPVVAVGAIVISLTYLTTVSAIFLVSMDRQKPLTILMAISAILTIPLDIGLVPFFEQQFDNGAIGGVVAYAITESLMLLGMLYLLPRGSLGAASLSFVLRVLACGAIMVAAVYPFRDQNLLLPIAIGIVTFVVGAALLRLVDADDRAAFASAMPDRFQRS